MARKGQGQRDVAEFELVPIEKVDVFRSVVGQLDAMVAKLRPGDSLGSERELAERLSVSRVSVREALRALQSMGKIEIRRNAGSFVVDPGGKMLAPLLTSSRPIDEGFIRDLVDVREAIETRVVALVGARRDELGRRARAGASTCASKPPWPPRAATPCSRGSNGPSTRCGSTRRSSSASSTATARRCTPSTWRSSKRSRPATATVPCS